MPALEAPWFDRVLVLGLGTGLSVIRGLLAVCMFVSRCRLVDQRDQLNCSGLTSVGRDKRPLLTRRLEYKRCSRPSYLAVLQQLR